MFGETLLMGMGMRDAGYGKKGKKYRRLLGQENAAPRSRAGHRSRANLELRCAVSGEPGETDLLKAAEAEVKRLLLPSHSSQNANHCHHLNDVNKISFK